MAQTNILLESGTNELEIVEFYINEDGYRGHYGFNVAKVVEIIRMENVTTMPQMSHFSVLGVFPYRDGKVIPLIDLALFLDKEPESVVDPKIIVTEFNKVQTAFLVSGVNRIYRLSWSDVEPPGKFLEKVSSQSITGVVKIEDRVIFLVDLEAIVATLQPSLALRIYETETPEEPQQKFRILHADDSASIRHLVGKMLEADGRFEVMQCNDGREAYNKLMEIKQEAFANNLPIESYLQGIITDIEMPFMDGLTLCKEVKDDPFFKNLSIAVFSSLITESLAHRAESVGADAQYAKPDLQAIADKMYELILEKNAKNQKLPQQA